MTESIIVDNGLSKKEKYESLIPQLVALTEGETDLIANTANIIAALKQTFSYFWIGIYFVKRVGEKEELVLGPFQGPVACVRISKGKGVCGTSWQNKKSIIVPDVELFPGHIACSPLSKSEIVIPIIKNDQVRAIIDVDSTLISDFDETDLRYLSEIGELISNWI